MAFAHGKVIGVVGRCNFYGTRTKTDINIIIGNDFDFAVYQRYDDFFADVFFHAVVFRVDGNGRIAHNRFRTGRGNHDVIIFTDDRIFDIPEAALNIRMVYFDIRQCRIAMRAPVGDTLSLVNEAFFI